MLTAVLSRADVSRHLQAIHLLRELREALTAQRTTGTAGDLHLEAAGTSTLVRQAALDGVPAWMVTVRTHGTSGARAVLQLHDGKTGKVLAIMDAVHLVSLRASLMSALAADVLARPDARNVAILGAGTAASSAIKSLRLVRSIEEVWFHEPNAADNFELAMRLQKTQSMAIRAVDTVEEAVANADIVVLTGDVPLAGVELAPGTHVTVLAAETFSKPPLSPAALAKMRRFVDAPLPALDWGVPFDAELAEVLAGKKPGRAGNADVTLFASVGPALLDLLAAWHVYEGARHDEGLTRIDLEA